MARDEQEGQRGLIQTLRNAAIRGTAAVMGVTVTHNCRHCGEVIMQGDNQPCGQHKPIPDGETIHIRFAQSPERLPEPKVARLGPSDKPQKSYRYKNTSEPDPIAKTPATPEPAQAEEETEDIWAEVRNTGGYRREPKSLDWNSSAKDFDAAIDRAQNGVTKDDDEHDPTPTLPNYLG